VPRTGCGVMVVGVGGWGGGDRSADAPKGGRGRAPARGGQQVFRLAPALVEPRLRAAIDAYSKALEAAADEDEVAAAAKNLGAAMFKERFEMRTAFREGRAALPVPLRLALATQST